MWLVVSVSAFWSLYYSDSLILNETERLVLITFLVLASMIGWLAIVAWQLRLAATKGKVWSRNGYVTRSSNETVFEGCVFFYWIALVWGTGMLIAITIAVIKQNSN
jgi:hypothetical protein